MKDYIRLGIFSKAIGLKGELKLHSYGDVLTLIEFPKTFILLDSSNLSEERGKRHNTDFSKGQQILSLDFASSRKVEILKLNPMPKLGFFKTVLAGVNDRDLASALTGKEIYYPVEEIPKLPEGDFYYYQLLGLSVVSNVTGEKLGIVASVSDYGAGTILEIKPVENSISKKDATVLIPFQDNYMEKTDLPNNKIILKNYDAFFSV